MRAIYIYTYIYMHTRSFENPVKCQAAVWEIRERRIFIIFIFKKREKDKKKENHPTHGPFKKRNRITETEHSPPSPGKQFPKKQGRARAFVDDQRVPSSPGNESKESGETHPNVRGAAIGPAQSREAIIYYRV